MDRLPAIAALVLWAAWGVLTLGFRVAIHVKETGTTGLHGIRAGASTSEWAAGILIVAATVAGIAAPILQLTGVAPLLWVNPIVRVAGGIGALIGVAATFGAQIAMGRSWRIGVDPGERTDLVTEGPFAVVRNPIFTTMIVTMVGLALLVANGVAAAAAVGMFVAIELQVRSVEEPYLTEVHGDAYLGYLTRVGRFVPGLGTRRSEA